MKRVLAGIAASAVLTATAITCQPARGPHAGADNHCPTGCIQTSDQSTIIVPDTVTIPTRGPFIIARPSGTSITISTYATTGNRPAPGRDQRGG